ncbi:DNA-binding transcriptional regulator, LysR family [Desulforhopalus singaporensis]|uniref:DNA-binding transcriptional regulator, LysR family n=1 Tax=Desulforhopalus singaporensis TaxID=91360 RepID=A0A1H0UNI8_9BACT|nr:DNA-binding transcriptional regulator, LysR family [Desulforhopalus singaporensis]
MSEHIQNLETHLSCRLFDRLGRTILPTGEAELLYSRARKILDDLQQLEEDISTSKKSVAGKLVIGASTIPGTYLLPRIAAKFKQNFSTISFEIRINDSAQIIKAVSNNDIYLAVVGAKTNEKKVNFTRFGHDQLVLAGAAEAGVQPTISMDELCTLPFITREEGSGTRKSIESFLARKQLGLGNLNICATLGSSAAVKEAIKANLGVSVISKRAITDELKSGQLQQIDVEGLEMERFFYIVTPSKRTLPNHYQLFMDTILAQHS